MPYSSPVIQEGVVQETGLDKVLLSLQQDFTALTWLEGNIFRRAYSDSFPNQEGDKSTFPQVYKGLGEYYNASINDNIPCAIFFQAKAEEKYTFDKVNNPRSIASERKVSLVFWGDAKKLADVGGGDYIFTEVIKPQFLRILAKNSHVMSIDTSVDEPIQEVFDGFTVFDQRQYNKYPYFGLRINFTVKYLTPVKPC